MKNKLKNKVFIDQNFKNCTILFEFLKLLYFKIIIIESTTRSKGQFIFKLDLKL